MFEQINEPISVLSLFQAGQARPTQFSWHGREYKIGQINLSYSKWEGRDKVYYFAVSDGTNYFKLKFSTSNLQWTLLETYVQ